MLMCYLNNYMLIDWCNVEQPSCEGVNFMI